MKKTIVFVAITILCMTVSCRYAQDASDTAYNQTKASTLLKRYEYFKDLAAAIDKKRADIAVYEAELCEVAASKEDQEYQRQRRTELIGIAGIYNSLVADYNSAMAKANYNFTNIGDLPDSNLEPLPKEYQNYKTKIGDKSKCSNTQ